MSGIVASRRSASIGSGPAEGLLPDSGRQENRGQEHECLRASKSIFLSAILLSHSAG
jgi:hypothetical protein